MVLYPSNFRPASATSPKVTENNLDGMGIEFTEIAPADRAILRRWLGLTSEETEPAVERYHAKEHCASGRRE